MNSTCLHHPGDTHAALSQGRRTFIEACQQLLLWILCLTLLALPARAEAPDIPWRANLSKRLAELGQRNWIVLADGAYPSLSERGVETLATGADAIPVLRTVLELLAQLGHVKPIPYTTTELSRVAESDAPGTGSYRSTVEQLFRGLRTGTAPMDSLQTKIEEASKTYRVLVIKTRMTLPYGTLFLQLEPSAWTPEAEKRLREVMGRP